MTYANEYYHALNRGNEKQLFFFEPENYLFFPRKIRIETNEQLLHLSRYIHLNPVEGNLASLPEDWIYSSYPEYIGTRKGSLPKPDIILNQFPNREAYRDFVMSQIDESDIDGLTLE